MEKLQTIMLRACKKHVVVPAFNIPYLEMVVPIADTLKKEETFALLEVARPDVEKFGAKSFKHVAEEYRRTADARYVRLHQDHVPVIDEDGKRVDWRALIKAALDLKYDSVMIDGSRLGLDENIFVTREVVQMAHAAGVPAEAELGAVLGHEKGPLPPYEELFATGKGFTDVKEAKRFVKETGVDWLSVAVGSVHGAISGAAKDQKKVESRINIEHLRKIAAATNIPLVLHGGSGIRKESVLEAVKNGITKINVGTALRQAYEKALKETGTTAGAQKAVSAELTGIIRDYYGISGSARELL